LKQQAEKGSGQLNFLTVLWLTFNYVYIFILLFFGWLLINAVLKIRKYLKEHGENNVNTCMLFWHSVAFGFFMLSWSLTAILFPIGWVVQNRYIWYVTDYVEIFSFFAQDLSLAVLCFILWELGTKEEPDTADVEVAIIEVEEFDEEAETQARIWNFFAVERADEFSCVVTSAQISRSESQRRSLAVNLN
jgi:hypothetical protein